MSTFVKLLLATTFFIFVTSLGFYIATDNSAKDHRRLNHDVAQLKAENKVLALHNDKLKAAISGLGKDSRLMERRVRNDLGMVRRDELLLLLNQPDRDYGGMQ
ncbi:MAG: hypothetical protein AUK47_23245 [Deltaproteobacteria bacterium CG2_30_63_29]|nr:MAG: hypothetical protein AUK47_23245 [Deltaproteobacteria bacterium CG2_30_63_29]